MKNELMIFSSLYLTVRYIINIILCYIFNMARYLQDWLRIELKQLFQVEDVKNGAIDIENKRPSLNITFLVRTAL